MNTEIERIKNLLDMVKQSNILMDEYSDFMRLKLSESLKENEILYNELARITEDRDGLLKKYEAMHEEIKYRERITKL